MTPSSLVELTPVSRLAAATSAGGARKLTCSVFSPSGDSFTGAVKTLSINAKTTIKRADKASDKAPDYRIFQGSVEYGAAWKKTSGEGRDYFSVKLDDPSFPAPIYATLVEAEEAGSHSLIWFRRNGD